MKIKSRQCTISEVLTLSFDIALGSSGYEKRARYLFQKHHITAQKKMCLCFNELKGTLSRNENDKAFRELGFELVYADSIAIAGLSKLFNEIEILLKTKDEISIIIDYSSMARIWYASVLSFCSNLRIANKSIRLTFSYSNSIFVEPKHQKSYNCDVEPIPGYYSISIPYKPTALIIGLGYIEKQAFGLAEYFDANPYLFLAKTDAEDPFYSEVCKINSTLINSVDRNNIFYYSLNNLDYCESLLYQLCKELQAEYRVVLAPCGPKPFTLISLITSIRNNEVDVWRISAMSDMEVIDKDPSGTIYLTEVSIES